GPAAIPLGPGLLPGSSHLPASLGRAGRGGFRRHACLFGVAPDGGCRVSPPSLAARDSSLWPYSSRRRARELPCILPCGARTFLPGVRKRAGRLPGRLPPRLSSLERAEVALIVVELRPPVIRPARIAEDGQRGEVSR